MKITHIQTLIVKLPDDEPLADGPAPKGATRDFVTLTIGTDQGIEGIGATFFGGALTGALRANGVSRVHRRSFAPVRLAAADSGVQ